MILSFLIFVAGALLFGLALSFFNYGFFAPPRFVGLANFQQLLHDPRLWPIFRTTLYYVVGMVGLDLVWSLVLALALNSVMPNILKLIFRHRLLLSRAHFDGRDCHRLALSVQRRYGCDQLAAGDRVRPAAHPWLISSTYVIPAVIVSGVWNGVGFNMVLFIAALRAVPSQLYEAAEIDGAGRWASFRNITLPMITPTIFFILVKGFIGVFQLFDQPYMLTSGGPGDASRSIVMYIYEIGFKTLNLGYASAVALLLFAVVLFLTLIQFAVQRGWVFYR